MIILVILTTCVRICDMACLIGSVSNGFGWPTSGSVFAPRFGSTRFRIWAKPNLLCLGEVVTPTRNKPAVFRPGWNMTTFPTLRFLYQLLQWRVRVLIVSWHDQYVDCAVLAALSLTAYQFAIRLIFVDWQCKKGKCSVKWADFRWRLNEYWLDHIYEMARWQSG